MKSLSTIELEKTNRDKLINILTAIDPSLVQLKMALEGLNINPVILIPIARALSNLATGTGYGMIKIQMTNGKVTLIRGEENIEINQVVIIDKNIVE